MCVWGRGGKSNPVFEHTSDYGDKVGFYGLAIQTGEVLNEFSKFGFPIFTLRNCARHVMKDFERDDWHFLDTPEARRALAKLQRDVTVIQHIDNRLRRLAHGGFAPRNSTPPEIRCHVREAPKISTEDEAVVVPIPLQRVREADAAEPQVPLEEVKEELNDEEAGYGLAECDATGSVVTRGVEVVATMAWLQGEPTVNEQGDPTEFLPPTLEDSLPRLADEAAGSTDVPPPNGA